MIFGTLILAALALLAVIIQLVWPTRAGALVYSWIAFGVLLGDVSLLVLGYWMWGWDEAWAPDWLAPTLLVVSAIALVPALIAQVVHVVHRLRRRA